MVGSRPTFATTQQLPNETAPLPISATFSTSANTAVITFDQALVPKVLGGGAGPWVIRIGNFAKTFVSKTMAGNTASIVCNFPGVPDAGPDTIIYTPPPDDVEGLAGTLPAAGFTIAPTIIP